MGPEDKPSTFSEQEYKYAWDWFSYHAAQRLTTFRFFLILIGVVVIGYFKCVELHWPRFGIVMGSFGGLIAVAFWLLEIRNEELVNCGRAALDRLEEKMQLTVRKDDVERKHLKKSLGVLSGALYCIIPESCGNKLVKHRFWLRSIHGVTFWGFVLAAIYAGRGFRWFW
jgi:hypothetical protein